MDAKAQETARGRKDEYVYDRLAAGYDRAMRPLERLFLARLRAERHLLGIFQIIVCRVE